MNKAAYAHCVFPCLTAPSRYGKYVNLEIGGVEIRVWVESNAQYTKEQWKRAALMKVKAAIEAEYEHFQEWDMGAGDE